MDVTDIRYLLNQLNGVQVICEDASPATSGLDVLLEELNAIVNWLDAHIETHGSEDFRLGVETGYMRASEKIRNVLKQYEGRR